LSLSHTAPNLAAKTAADDVDATFTITELAEEFSITARSIRFYEDKGLIQPKRSGTARIYNRRDRGRLILILRGKRLGFSLAEIQEMLDLYDHSDDRVEQLKTMLLRSRERLDALAQQRRDIDNTTAELEDACRQIEATLADKGVPLDDI
jgi:DNA-binding transcriptional MerR regulator